MDVTNMKFAQISEYLGKSKDNQLLLIWENHDEKPKDLLAQQSKSTKSSEFAASLSHTTDEEQIIQSPHESSNDNDESQAQIVKQPSSSLFEDAKRDNHAVDDESQAQNVQQAQASLFDDAKRDNHDDDDESQAQIVQQAPASLFDDANQDNHADGINENGNENNVIISPQSMDMIQNSQTHLLMVPVANKAYMLTKNTISSSDESTITEVPMPTQANVTFETKGNQTRVSNIIYSEPPTPEQTQTILNNIVRNPCRPPPIHEQKTQSLQTQSHPYLIQIEERINKTKNIHVKLEKIMQMMNHLAQTIKCVQTILDYDPNDEDQRRIKQIYIERFEKCCREQQQLA
eukprot:1637_1